MPPKGHTQIDLVMAFLESIQTDVRELRNKVDVMEKSLEPIANVHQLRMNQNTIESRVRLVEQASVRRDAQIKTLKWFLGFSWPVLTFLLAGVIWPLLKENGYLKTFGSTPKIKIEQKMLKTAHN